ncbi:MAG: protein arginine kinase [bacterium]
MKLRYMVGRKTGWLTGKGPSMEVVVSSRIRLARNLGEYYFPNKAAEEQQREVFDKISEAVKKSDYLKTAEILRLNDLEKVDRQLLMERHLISYEHARGKGERGVVIDDQEIISIMINEEDHLRIQALQPGFQLMQVWDFINKIDDDLSKYLNYACSEDCGYLTSCPTNTGTGIRASVLIHLPGLVTTGEINKVLEALSKLGLAARGLYGEGTRVMGDFFQISNQITLGQNEENIIDNIERVVKQIIGYELKSREMLLKENVEENEDKIYRAYGILKSARTISFVETMELLSKVRLGINMKLKLGVEIATLNELMILTQPAHLQELSGNILNAPERDIMRAKFIREKLSEKTTKS